MFILEKDYEIIERDNKKNEKTSHKKCKLHPIDLILLFQTGICLLPESQFTANKTKCNENCNETSANGTV